MGKQSPSKGGRSAFPSLPLSTIVPPTKQIPLHRRVTVWVRRHLRRLLSFAKLRLTNCASPTDKEAMEAWDRLVERLRVQK